MLYGKYSSIQHLHCAQRLTAFTSIQKQQLKWRMCAPIAKKSFAKYARRLLTASTKYLVNKIKKENEKRKSRSKNYSFSKGTKGVLSVSLQSNSLMVVSLLLASVPRLFASPVRLRKLKIKTASMDASDFQLKHPNSKSRIDSKEILVALKSLNLLTSIELSERVLST